MAPLIHTSSEYFASILPEGEARAREWQWDGVSPESGLRHLCPLSVGKNSVTRSHLAVARKGRKFHLAVCPGERGRRFEEYLAGLSPVCQRHDVPIRDPCRVRRSLWCGVGSPATVIMTNAFTFCSSAYWLGRVIPPLRNQFNTQFLAEDLQILNLTLSLPRCAAFLHRNTQFH